MADVRLWTTVRTQSEIVAQMRQRLSGNEDGLVAYYRLDDDPLSAVASDSTASGNDAVFSGNPTRILADVPLCDP